MESATVSSHLLPSSSRHAQTDRHADRQTDRHTHTQMCYDLRLASNESVNSELLSVQLAHRVVTHAGEEGHGLITAANVQRAHTAHVRIKHLQVKRHGRKGAT